MCKVKPHRTITLMNNRPRTPARLLSVVPFFRRSASNLFEVFYVGADKLPHVT
jgi:hypothetical protein